MGKTKMRTPTLTIEQAESELGPRGHLLVNSDNRRMVRKWLVAQGYPAAFADTLTVRELSNAYNETDGTGLAVLRRKLKITMDGIAANDAANGVNLPSQAYGAPINDDVSAVA